MTNQLLFSIIFIISVMISSISQLLLKKAAIKKYPSIAASYLNPLVIFAYLLFFGSTLVTVVAFRYVALSMGPIFEALGYVFVAILSFFILKERLSKRTMIGMLLIIGGVVIAAISI